ncbi:hypothetical protein [Streptomyces sp. NPDC059909]|uniref:hypothetical protein n=1 Tax=Streptomyces sp. NPDC059909 TaxID=3346998 RepID=UPI00364B922C
MTGGPVTAADITVDGTGLLYVTRLLKLCARIAVAEPNTVVHVIATHPAAPLDLAALAAATAAAPVVSARMMCGMYGAHTRLTCTQQYDRLLASRPSKSTSRSAMLASCRIRTSPRSP